MSTLLRYGLIALLIIIGLLTSFLGIVAAFFADGGSVFDRIFLGIINPVAYVLSIVELFNLRIMGQSLGPAALFASALAFIWAVVLSVLIWVGIVGGDWFVPLIPGIPLGLYVMYTLWTNNIGEKN